MSEEPIRGDHSPGAGGWPTIRYFNKETGYGGQAYTKKTSGAMCDELGNDKYMTEYVEEAGHTYLCNALTLAGCSEKQGGFATKWSKNSLDKIDSQLARLEGMKGKSMAEDLKAWLFQRIGILSQLQKAQSSEAASKEEL